MTEYFKEGNLIVRYAPQSPLELEWVTKSFSGLLYSHNRFFYDKKSLFRRNHYKLYVQEIRKGSIILDLISLASNYDLSDITDKCNHIIEFSKNMQEISGFFRRQRKTPPEGLTSTDARHFADILEPPAKDAGGALQIIATDGGTNNVTINFNHEEAVATRQNALNWAAAQKIPENDIERDMLFYWYQARDAAAGSAGDKGIIESITKSPVKTIIPNDVVKSKMLKEALFKKAYVVDVRVQTIEGKPSLYTILRVSDSFDR
ncbi:MAG: hypothetical protein ABF931_09470 [Acetobacter pasteurianus]